MSSLFLSYSHKDRDLAKRIATDLSKQGLSVWLDEWEILVGDSIAQRVQQGLSEVDYVAVLLTKHSLASGWVEKEWQSQIGIEAERRQIRILPVLGDECSIPPLLRDKRCAALNHDYDEGLSDLIRAIRGHSSRNSGRPPTDSAPTNRSSRSLKRQKLLVVIGLLVIGIVVASFVFFRSSFLGTSKPYEFNQNQSPARFAKRSHIVTPAESYKIREVLQLPALDYSSFELLEDRRVIDLRDWKPFEKGAQGRISPVTWSRKVRLRKVKNSDWVRFAFSTEGAGIDAECSSGQDYHLETAIAASSPSQVLMKSFHVIVNVASYPVGQEFEIEFRATFWNGTSEREDWTAVKIHVPMKVSSIMILFPENKPFQWNKLVMYTPDSRDESLPPENQRGLLYTPDSRTLFWELRAPIVGNTYEIQWRW